MISHNTVWLVYLIEKHFLFILISNNYSLFYYNKGIKIEMGNSNGLAAKSTAADSQWDDQTRSVVESILANSENPKVINFNLYKYP